MEKICDKCEKILKGNYDDKYFALETIGRFDKTIKELCPECYDKFEAWLNERD
ncbi:MAG: hypothetical protein AABY22_04420 [Nanoarchaeota archaeon]